MLNKLIVRQLGIKPYEEVLFKMQEFTKKRTKINYDEIWLVQHPKVFTKGVSDKRQYLTNYKSIPIIQSDRGGKTTFHGLGQQLMYILLDLNRRNISLKKFMNLLYKTVIYTLKSISIISYAKTDTPGIYVENSKICSFGLRIHKGCSFHGLALNISMDLSPFSMINPCGFSGLKMTQVKNFSSNSNINMISSYLVKEFAYLLQIKDIVVYYNFM